MKKPSNEVLKATIETDGSIFVRNQRGNNAITPDTTFIVGAFFAPAGTLKKNKLRIVARALDTQHW